MRESRRQAVAVCVLVVAVVLAGCQAPVAEDSTANQADDTDAGEGVMNGTDGDDGSTPGANATEITVKNGTLAVDPGVVYDRLRTLKDTDVPAPEQIRAFDSQEELENFSATPRGDPPQFFEVVGYNTTTFSSDGIVQRIGNGYVTGLGTVVVFPNPDGGRDDEQLLLAHELTHYLQQQEGRYGEILANVDVSTTDGQYVRRSLIEGAAVTTTDAYLREYGETDTLNSPAYVEWMDTIPPGQIARYSNSQYVNGTAYIEQRIESTDDIGTVYERPPETSAEILHGPDVRTRPLPVRVDAGSNWRQIGSDRMGEAFLRYALESDVAPERASDAAAGWANDSLQIFQSSETANASYAWVIRWNDSTAGETFERTVSEYLDAYGDPAGDRWTVPGPARQVTLRTPAPETTVLLFGPDSFLQAVQIAETADAITIEIAPRNH